MPVRIVVLPHLPYTGIRTRGWQMAKALAARPGVEVHFLSWAAEEPGSASRVGRAFRRVGRALPWSRGRKPGVREGVRVRPLRFLDPGLAALGVPLRLIRSRNTKRLREAILQIRPDWVITGAGHTAPFPFDTGIAAAIDIFDDHFPEAGELADVRRVDAVAAAAMERAALLIGASSSIAEKYETVTGRPVVCVPNGHDLEALPREMQTRATMRRRFDLPAGARIVAYPGNHGPHARIPLLVEIMRRVRSMDPGVRCALAGPIERRSDRDLARGEPSIHVLGPVDPGRIAGLLAACDAGILLAEPTPFRSNALPIKILEYGACGLPAVAPCLRELERLRLPHVRLVPGDDIDGWASSLITALRTPFDPAWSPALDEYAWPTLARRLLESLADQAGPETAR